VVERFLRVDRDNLQVDITMEDPEGTREALDSRSYTSNLKPEWDIMELACTDNAAFEDFEK